MRSAVVKNLGLSWLCALSCACGSGQGSGTGIESGGTAGQGGAGAVSNVGGFSASGASGGSGNGGSMGLSSAEKTMLFGQAPHCSMGADYQLEGSIDGSTVHDVHAGFTGGYVNGNNAHFETPSANSPDPTRVKIMFDWSQSLAHGEASTVAQGIVVPPLGNPRAGEELCITQGVVGFVMGGAEDGVFKFWLHGARAGTDCSGEDVPIDLRGCM